MIVNDQNQPCQFWYFGNDATIDDTDYIAQALYLDAANCQISGVERKPVLEIFTATFDAFYPDVPAHVDQILSQYPSFSPVIMHDDDGLESPDSEGLQADFNIGVYSYGAIDRVEESTGEVFNYRSGWNGYADNRMSTTAPVMVEFDSISYDAVTRVLNVTVSGEFMRSLSGDLRFNVSVVEDNITGYPQSNIYDTDSLHPFFGAGNPIAGFVHNDVHRASLGGAWGTAGIIPSSVSSGDSYSTSYSYILPAGIDPSEVKLLGVVCEYDTLINQRQIFNSSGYVPMPFVCPIEVNFSDSLANGQVLFTDESTGNPTSHFWVFGDGTTSNQQNPVHTYFNEGVYTVCQIATSSCGSDTICRQVSVFFCDNPSGQAVSDIQGTQATISWDAIPSAISYKLKVRKVGTSTWLNNTILAPTTFKVRTNLEPNTDYEYQLKTVCDNNSPTGFGVLGFFTTGDFPCDNPTVHSVTDITATGAKMHWNSVPNVNKYKVKIRVVGTTTWSFHTIWAPDTFKVRTGLLPNTDYEYKVKTFCDFNTPLSWGAFQYFTTLGECGDPTGLTATDIEAAQATISWNAVAGAVSYKLRVREVGTSNWLYNTIVAPTTMKVRTNLQPNTDYEYSLKTICSDGSSTGYGPNSNFTTLDYPCDNPSIISTANIEETQATIIWDSQANATKYKVKVREAGTTTWDFHTVWAPTTFKVKTGLSPSTDYEYKVKTVCAFNSPLSWSGFHYFTTLSTEPGARLTSNDVDQLINVFPNPTTGQITVVLGEAEQATVVVRSIHGQVISTKSVSSNKVELEIEGAAGLYSVEVITENGLNEVFRIVKQ